MKQPALTIGMACYDDFDGVYYTVQALRFYHTDVMERCEIVVVDNNPDSPQGKATRDFVQGAARSVARYVPFTERKGSCPPRGHLFEAANGDFVACIDCHVFLLPDSV
ncbi:MAG: glycosyltransferase family 2 protein [Planctomycetaceae bacterium]